MNNRGISLLELIISLSLISIVLILVYSLLVNVSNEVDNTNYASNNQLNRVEIIKTVENDLTNNSLDNIELSNNTLSFIFDKGVSSLNVLNENNKYYLSYIDINGNKNKWEIKNGYINLDGKKIFSICKMDKLGKLSIMVNTNNDLNNGTYNNIIDDIVIYFNIDRLDNIIDECY